MRPVDTVPAVTEVRRAHSAHTHCRAAVRHDRPQPHLGQPNPPGHRNVAKYSTHDDSSGNPP